LPLATLPGERGNGVPDEKMEAENGACLRIRDSSFTFLYTCIMMLMNRKPALFLLICFSLCILGLAEQIEIDGKLKRPLSQGFTGDQTKYQELRGSRNCVWILK